jgi:AraC family transcriptional regulator, regulatory protein of adaptative response / methylated-DNA-[protein]-cysteine methyltransferase
MSKSPHNGAGLPLTPDAMWAAVRSRDSGADGTFVYSVRTTGVYCRPSCPSRRANRENVAFHQTPKDAALAGFRPCKRCRPNEQPLAKRRAARIAEICRRIETANGASRLVDLARLADMSPYHFHRVFKDVTGLTPKQYAVAHRAKRVRSQLSLSPRITDAILDAGFSSGTRFYEESKQVLGMTASKYRAGGDGVQIWFAIGECSLGSILVARSTNGICAILLGDDPNKLATDLQDRFTNADLIGGDGIFEQWVAGVVGFVDNPAIGLNLPLDIRGTAFQRRVWQALRRIPVGSTASYADIAQRIGAPKAVRAVARACATNTIAIAIPCHRVVRSDGALSGYRWGVERKRALLDREAASV